jgi:hypothetical protein
MRSNQRQTRALPWPDEPTGATHQMLGDEAFAALTRSGFRLAHPHLLGIRYRTDCVRGIENTPNPRRRANAGALPQGANGQRPPRPGQHYRRRILHDKAQQWCRQTLVQRRTINAAGGQGLVRPRR